MEMILLSISLLALLILVSVILTIRKTKRNKAVVFLELLLFIVFSLGSLLFIIFGFINKEPYYKQIDPVDFGYEPFASNHLLTIVVIASLGIISTITIWRKGKKLPPLTLALCISFMVLFSIVLIPIMMQIDDMYIMWVAPLTYIITSILLITRLVEEEVTASTERHYRNKVLNYLNQKLVSSSNYGLWLVITLLPVLSIIMLILILFGQEYNSIVKVFTETTTWTFSTKTHPPYLGHNGHYLCTVAACGSPKIVKPKRLGTRYGNTIIVNRQLMIANAFEEMIQDESKNLHRVLRSFYDKYGYPISKNINSELWSNITYIIMKPLEWTFLISLYLFSMEPEVKISKQYELK